MQIVSGLARTFSRLIFLFGGMWVSGFFEPTALLFSMLPFILSIFASSPSELVLLQVGGFAHLAHLNLASRRLKHQHDARHAGLVDVACTAEACRMRRSSSGCGVSKRSHLRCPAEASPTTDAANLPPIE